MEELTLNYNFADTDIIDPFIRVTKRQPDDFLNSSLGVLDLVLGRGISAIVGLTKGDENSAIQAYLFDKENWTLESASQWVYDTELLGTIKTEVSGEEIIRDLKDMLDSLTSKIKEDRPDEIREEIAIFADLKSISGVEIFEAGEHNGDLYTVEDLVDMVNNFSSLKETLRPYVKLGHNPDQKLLAIDGLPSAGWIEKIYVEGAKLLADISDIPNTIYELIKNRAYRRVSSEIYWNFKDNTGKVYNRALKAISMLGGDTPAVGSLSDILALYKKREFLKTYNQSSEHDELKMCSIDLITKKEAKDRMDKATELQKQVTDLETSNKETAKKYSDELEQLKTEKAESEKRYADLQVEKKHQEIETTVKQLISDKKIVPAQKEIAIGLYSSQAGLKKYSNGEDIQSDLLTTFFSANPDVIDSDPTTKAKDPKDDSREAKEKVFSEKVQDSKVSYQEAREFRRELNEGEEQ